MSIFDFFKKKTNQKTTGKNDYTFELKQIVNKSQEDFVDLTFTIETFHSDDHYYIADVKGKYNDKTVGFRVNFLKGMEGMKNSDPKTLHFYKKGIKFYNLGMISDEFFGVLQELYGIKGYEAKMRAATSLTSVALQNSPLDFNNGKIAFKVFFDDKEEENRYAEMYVNIDLSKSIVEIKEKDPEYRENIIKGFLKPDDEEEGIE